MSIKEKQEWAAAVITATFNKVEEVDSVLLDLTKLTIDVDHIRIKVTSWSGDRTLLEVFIHLEDKHACCEGVEFKYDELTKFIVKLENFIHHRLSPF